MTILAGATSLSCDFCDATWVGTRPPAAWSHYQLRKVDWHGNYMPGQYSNFVLCKACAGEELPSKNLFQRLFAKRSP